MRPEVNRKAVFSEQKAIETDAAYLVEIGTTNTIQGVIKVLPFIDGPLSGTETVSENTFV